MYHRHGYCMKFPRAEYGIVLPSLMVLSIWDGTAITKSVFNMASAAFTNSVINTG